MRTLLIDTRQQSGKHVLKDRYFREHGIKTFRSKLPVGDYTTMQDMSIVIDTKRSMDEICQNLCQTKEHERFRREADNAHENGIRLIVLIENDDGIKTLDDVKTKWSNPRMHRYNTIAKAHREGKWKTVKLPPKPVSNVTMFKIMYSFGKKHHVEWRFCTPEKAGQIISEILKLEEE